MLDDLRHALRRLRENLGLTLVVMALLALGLGASLTALGVADSVLIDPLPYPESERLVGFYEQNLEAGFPAAWRFSDASSLSIKPQMIKE